jgi:hypothetical protein
MIGKHSLLQSPVDVKVNCLAWHTLPLVANTRWSENVAE